MGSEYVKAKFILKRSNSSGPNIVHSNSVVLQVCSPDQQLPPSPENLLGMQILEPFPEPTESEILVAVPNNLCFHKPCS